MFKLKLFAATAAAVILLSASSFAQETNSNRESFRKEVHQYTSENIVPVMKPRRQQLETYLSADEKNKIKEVRAEMAAHRAEMQKLHESFGKGRQPGTRPDEAQMSQMREKRETHRASMEAIRTIAENHKGQIDQLLSPLSQESEKWRTDIHAIAEKNGLSPRQKPAPGQDRPAGKPEFERGRGGDGPGHGPGHGPGFGRGPGFGPGTGMLHITEPVGFLLWDADAGFPMIRESGDFPRTYPNPTATSSNLEYQVKTAGKVTVSILNEKGIPVKTLVDGTLQPGKYEISTDVSGLEKGMYFYQIKTPDGVQTQKLLIEKN
ncbi:MAG: T9SS type A sorting domain-containing protein [Bacteroidia bacterium]